MGTGGACQRSCLRFSLSLLCNTAHTVREWLLNFLRSAPVGPKQQPKRQAKQQTLQMPKEQPRRQAKRMQEQADV